MRTDQYTPETICQCLDLPGFEIRSSHGEPVDAMRLLLQPSFHPEICLTLTRTATAASVSVVAARWIIWRQLSPAPMLTDRDEGDVSLDCYRQLAESLRSAAASSPTPGITIDGMPIDGILMASGQADIRFHHNPRSRTSLSEAISKVIGAAWAALHNAC